MIVKFNSAQITDDIKGNYASTWKVGSIHSLCIAYNDPRVKFQGISAEYPATYLHVIE